MHFNKLILKKRTYVVEYGVKCKQSNTDSYQIIFLSVTIFLIQIQIQIVSDIDIDQII